MKKKITLSDLRQAFIELNDSEVIEDTEKMSDEALLDCNFREDLQMDSLDVLELMLIVEKNCSISVPDDSYERFERNGGTVRAALEEINSVINR